MNSPAVVLYRNVSSMFEKLKSKWKVDGWKFFLIMCVFAITGTTTAFLTRQITRWLELDAGSLWYWLLKIGVLLIGYWILILIVALPFGQFRFFWEYEKKLWGRISGRNKKAVPESEPTGTGKISPERSLQDQH